MSATDLLARSLSKVRALVSAGQRPREASERDIARLRQQIQECAESRGGEVSTRQRAARLAEAYLRLNDNGRRRFLLMIALEFGPDPARVAKAHEAYQAAVGSPGQWDAEARLRGAMRSRQ